MIDDAIAREILRNRFSNDVCVRVNVHEGLESAFEADAELRVYIAELLVKHGSVLISGSDIGSPEQFREKSYALIGCPLPYTERSSPRSVVDDGVYTSTEYPAKHPIMFHNENSYQKRWPLRLAFYCQEPPLTGGSTPLASNRTVTKLIPEEMKDVFKRKGILYERTYGQGIGLTWQEVFQTEDRRDVDQYCEANQLERIWIDENTLQTRRVGNAFSTHPKTGEELWFNHAAFFNAFSLPGEVREALAEELGEDRLPSQTYFGDRTPIQEDVVRAINDAYEDASIRFSWAKGDLLLVDNMLTAHARDPYTGPRKILVSMADLSS